MTIVLYYTPTCPYSKLTEDLLKERGVLYRRVNVSETTNAEAVRRMVSLSGQMGVPVVECDGKIVVGFNRQAIIELIKPKKA